LREPGRIAAAIEVLTEIADARRPASEALRDWGKSHRFAGSGDRAAIGNIVYDALRRRASIAWRMGSDAPRALALGVMAYHWGWDEGRFDAQFADDEHAPDVLSAAEKAAIAKPLDGARDWVRADIPEWCADQFEENFAEDWVEEGAALAERPPLDLRVNTLLASPEKAAKALRKRPDHAPIAPTGLRYPARGMGARTPNVTPESVYQKGWIEVQDEGSQIAALLVGAQEGDQVLDYCAGAGGKTLAMAAAMRGKGQVYAYDADIHRLAPIHERLTRAKAHNVQVREPGKDSLDDLAGKMDRVLIDAPCTGSGVWRRHPDAKWRLSPEALARRQSEQMQVLSEAKRFVKPGGYLVYVTCSVFPAENEDRIEDFLLENGGFELVSVGEVWQDVFGFDKPKPWSADMLSVTLTPASTGTDGFFVAAMQRVEG